MPPTHPSTELDLTAMDLAVLGRARTVMRQLLLPCLEDPLNREALQAVWRTHCLLADDITAVTTRLGQR